MKKRIVLDFEAYSPVDISRGSARYAQHPQADIICMYFNIEGEEGIRGWVPGMDLPKFMFDLDQYLIYAHNALFDYRIWMNIGVWKYDFPMLHLDQVRDSMAIAQRYTFPAKLLKAGEAAGISMLKSPQGTRLIKKICCPTKYGTRPKVGTDFHEFELSEFYEYCAQDVRSTAALLDALPADYLTDKEQKIWLMTQEMNLTGLPVDIDEITRVHDYVDGFVAELSHRVVELSEGQVHKVTQVAKLKDWINSKGVYAADMRADTVVNLLKLDTLPDDVREMLELRQTLGRSSTAKFKKLIKLHYKGRIYDNLRYYGTSTGRWSGMGFQVHNLPRAHVKDPEKMIEKFLNFEPVEDPVNVAKALIRPMIKAPEGKVLVVSDYSAIENCILAWVAREDPALDLIESGKSSYLDMAAFMRNISYKEMERSYRADEGTAVFDRWLGKIIVLGCGYQMGAARFQVTAEAWGQEISLGLAKRAVDAYRRKHPMIKRFWSRVMSCAIAAVANPGQAYMYNRCIFKVVQDRTRRPWLVLTLPSMRKLFYAEPRMSTSRYGDVVRHKGIDPYSKKWTWLSLTPGRITENIVQALARDIMAHGLLNVRDNMKEVELMASVHDEALGLADEDKADLDRFNELLCELPEWAETPRHLPLKAEGYVAQRYKKG